MSIYEEIESEIADRLAAVIGAGIDVTVLPERQADYSRPFVNGQVTVCYHSSKYAEPNSTAQMSQYEDISFILAIQSRTLRGDKGIYEIASKCRRYLIGFEPTNCHRMWAKEFGLQDGKIEDNLWTYYAIFCTRTLAVEDYAETFIADELAIVSYENELTGNNFDTQNP